MMRSYWRMQRQLIGSSAAGLRSRSRDSAPAPPHLPLAEKHRKGTGT